MKDLRLLKGPLFILFVVLGIPLITIKMLGEIGYIVGGGLTIIIWYLDWLRGRYNFLHYRAIHNSIEGKMPYVIGGILIIVGLFKIV